MRLLGLILVLMIVPISSQSSEKRDFTLCSEIARSVNEYLGMHSAECNVLGVMIDSDYDKDQFRNMLDTVDRSLTTASKYATIYIAKCKPKRIW